MAQDNLVMMARKIRSIVEKICFEIEKPKLGGENVIVEIDESCFGKRKHNRGKRTRSQWVFGCIDRNTKEVLIVPVERRNKDTLLPIIQEYILPGNLKKKFKKKVLKKKFLKKKFLRKSF